MSNASACQKTECKQPIPERVVPERATAGAWCLPGQVSSDVCFCTQSAVNQIAG
jgi:hypothetical protein